MSVSVHFLRSFTVDLDGIQYVAMPCLFVEALAKKIVHKEHSKEKTLLA